MNALYDTALDIFFYFRLGNQAQEKEMMYHYILQVDREIHIRRETGMNAIEYESNEEIELQKKNEHENVSTKIIHDHLVKQRRQLTSVLTDPKPFEQIQACTAVAGTSGAKSLRIIVISDTHERHYTLGTLPRCDILIHAGDILMSSRVQSEAKVKHKLRDFNNWMKQQDASYKIVVGGNHDKLLEEFPEEILKEIFTDCTYLCNTAIDAMGVKIWASPCSQGASDNKAFQSKEFRMAAEDAARKAGPVDILVTHGTCDNLQAILRPRLMHISGHYHLYHGLHIYEMEETKELITVAAPIMDHRYNPHNLPIMVDCHIADKFIA